MDRVRQDIENDCCPRAGTVSTASPALLTEQQGLYDARARVLKALAHPTRLYMVDQLARRECCVCELQEMVGADMSTISKHLSVLKAAGVVADDKRGKQVWYRLRVPCILNFFGCVEEVLRQDAADRRAVVEPEQPR